VKRLGLHYSHFGTPLPLLKPLRGRFTPKNSAFWRRVEKVGLSEGIRPIYHKRDETIRGHVFCSFLALLLKQELESRIKVADLQWEWKEVIRGLDALQQVEAN
jgi:hypothetical protein